jgi:hypothetical protein
MSTTPEIVSSLRDIFRHAVAEDARAIRDLKPQVRSEQRAESEQAPGLQSRLARLRREARARHVAYSLWKGRCWAEVENNRPDGDPFLAFAVAKAWKDAASAAGVTGQPPGRLLAHIARWL